MKKTTVTLVLFIVFFQAIGQIINVPSDYSSIQEAINNSASGDTIIVSEGTYKENLVLNNKNIVLCSKYIESHDNEDIKNTVLDGNHNSSVITIEENIDSTTCIIGFTILNGNGKEAYFEENGVVWDTVYYGGGIYVGDSCFPVLKDLIIKDNIADFGGGIGIKGGTAVVENTIITNNHSTTKGGGIYYSARFKGFDIISSVISNNTSNRGGGVDYMSGGFWDKRLYIKDTEISGNIATYNGPHGYESGGALRGGNAQVILENVTLINNKGLTDFCLANYMFQISNSIIWNNKISLFSQHGDSIPTLIKYSDVENGKDNFIITGYNTLEWGDGNINVYPDFVDTSSANFHLLNTSPCIDAGNPDSSYNDSDNSLNDMGAYEYPKTVSSASQPAGWTDGSGGVIMNLAELRWLSETPYAWDESWKLGADIDASETRFWNIEKGDTLGFKPIAFWSFSASFDGQGYKISNLYINRPEEFNVGFIGKSIYSESRFEIVENLQLVDVSISGENYVGGLVGNSYKAQISNCSVTGKVSGNTFVGGLVGESEGSKITECFAICAVSAASDCAGGLVGKTMSPGSILDCFTAGRVSGSKYVGGIVGWLFECTVLLNSYTTSVIEGTEHPSGAVIGFQESAATAYCKYDSSVTDSLGIAKSDGSCYSLFTNSVDALTTKQFSEEINFPKWNFDTVWTIALIPEIDSVPRPYLQWAVENNPSFQQISLHAGWNLISINRELENSTVEDVFKSISENIVEVKQADLFYNSSNPDFLNGLNTIEPSVAYLINVKSDVKLLIKGNAVDPADYKVNLHRGWNLVGNPYSEAMPIESVLSGVIDKVEIVKSSDGFYIPDNSDSILEKTEPGKGMFIKVSEDCLLEWK